MQGERSGNTTPLRSLHDHYLARAYQRPGAPKGVLGLLRRKDDRPRHRGAGPMGDHLVFQYQSGRHDARPDDAGPQSRRHRQPAQHHVDARHGVPRVLHASRVHVLGGRVRPDPGSLERHDLVHRRHLSVCTAVLGVRLRVHVRVRQRLDRAPVLLPARRAARPIGSTGVAFLAFFLFQYAFADTCSTVTTGAMVGRTAFGGDLLYSVAVSGFIYPILGHWVWGPDGWLATMKTPFHDFAGSTVVHSIGGFIALAGAIALGPRHRPQVQAGRRWHATRSRHGDRRGRRCDPVVRLVRLQPRQHALGDGLRGHRPGRDQHDARRRGGRSRGDVRRLSTSPQVGHGHLDQRLPRRAGRDHVSVLLGLAVRCDLHRRDRRCRRGPRCRPARVPADRRPDRRLARSRTLRHLGHVESRPVRHRPVRRCRRRPGPTRRRPSRACSTAAASTSCSSRYTAA